MDVLEAEDEPAPMLEPDPAEGGGLFPSLNLNLTGLSGMFGGGGVSFSVPSAAKSGASGFQGAAKSGASGYGNWKPTDRSGLYGDDDGPL